MLDLAVWYTLWMCMLLLRHGTGLLFTVRQSKDQDTGVAVRCKRQKQGRAFHALSDPQNIQERGYRWAVSWIWCNYVEYFLHACVLLCDMIRKVDLNTRIEYAYFFFYSFVRGAYIKRLTRKLPPGSKLPPLSTAAELLLGAVAGALAQIFTIPVAVIATRQQVGRPNRLARVPPPEADDENDDSFLAVAREIIEEEGVTGLWLGLKPGLVLTVNPAITYGVFERVKSLVLLARNGNSTKMSPGLNFIVGALSKTLATIVCRVSCSRILC